MKAQHSRLTGRCDSDRLERQDQDPLLKINQDEVSWKASGAPLGEHGGANRVCARDADVDSVSLRM